MSLEGQTLGHYRLVQLIGRGGMGEVYLAADMHIPRQVAIKVVQDEPSGYPDKEAVEDTGRLFYREMKAIAALDHPHILPLFDFGEEKRANLDIAYMVMPYRSDGSLLEWLRKRQTTERLSPEDVGYLLTQAADALQHAHEHSIVHQDVKPSNFLVRPRQAQPTRPDIFLTDFGVAKFTTATATASQSVRGTPAYMAPEQWQGQVVPATDQYALAIMAYLLLAGRFPFNGRMEQIMHQHFQEPPQPPSTFNTAIKPALDAVLLHALEKKPEARFPNILDFANAFQQALRYQDYHTTLQISTQEAQQGTRRTIMISEKHEVTVTIPANIQHNQTIRLDGHGMDYYPGGPTGPLLLTIHTLSEEKNARISPDTDQLASTIPARYPLLDYPIPPVAPALPTPPTIPAPSLLSHTPVPTSQAAPSPSLPPYQQVSYGEHTLPASESGQLVIRRFQATDALSGSSAETDRLGGSSQVINPVTPLPPLPTTRRSLTPMMLLLLAIAVLIIVSSIGGFAIYQSRISQINVDATANAQFATSQAQNVANATATAQSQATPLPTATHQGSAGVTATVPANYPYPSYMSGQGTLTMYDPLSQPNNWQANTASDGSACRFNNNAYLVSQATTGFFFSCPSSPTFSNFAFEVQMTVVQGDCGGMLFRSDPSIGSNYYFQVCQNGSYELTKYADKTGNNTVNLLNGTSSAIAGGAGQANTLAVLVSSNNITLYVNSQQIDNTQDSSYSTGHLALFANAINNPTQVAFSNAKVWTF